MFRNALDLNLDGRTVTMSFKNIRHSNNFLSAHNVDQVIYMIYISRASQTKCGYHNRDTFENRLGQQSKGQE